MSAQALLRPTASGFTFARGRGVIGGGGAFAPSQPRGGRAPPTNGLSFSSSKYSTSGLTRSRRNPLASPSKNSRSVGGSFVASAVAGGESLESQRQKQQTQHDDVGEEAATTADVVNNILPKEWPNNRAGFLKKKIRVQIIKNITLDVEPDATLHDVKAMIEYQENIPAEDQLLYFAQKQLPDDLPVTHSNIPRKSTLVMRLRGEVLFIYFFTSNSSFSYPTIKKLFCSSIFASPHTHSTHTQNTFTQTPTPSRPRTHAHSPSVLCT